MASHNNNNMNTNTHIKTLTNTPKPIVQLVPILSAEKIMEEVCKNPRGTQSRLASKPQILKSVLEQVNKEGKYIEIIPYAKEVKFVDLEERRLAFDKIDRDKYECVIIESLRNPVLNMDDHNFIQAYCWALKMNSDDIKDKAIQGQIKEIINILTKRSELAYEEVTKSMRENIRVTQEKYRNLKQVDAKVMEQARRAYKILELAKKEPERIVMKQVLTTDEAVRYVNRMKENLSYFCVVNVSEIKEWEAAANEIHNGIRVYDLGEETICCWLKNKLLVSPMVDRRKYRFVRIDKLNSFKTNKIDLEYMRVGKNGSSESKQKLVGRNLNQKIVLKDLSKIGNDNSDRVITNLFVSELWTKSSQKKNRTDQAMVLQCKNWIAGRHNDIMTMSMVKMECELSETEKWSKQINRWLRSSSELWNSRVKMKKAARPKRKNGGGKPRQMKSSNWERTSNFEDNRYKVVDSGCNGTTPVRSKVKMKTVKAFKDKTKCSRERKVKSCGVKGCNGDGTQLVDRRVGLSIVDGCKVNKNSSKGRGVKFKVGHSDMQKTKPKVKIKA